jgi:hypothetical protein
MPQRKGFEPFFYIWVVTVVRTYRPPFSQNFGCADSRVAFFTIEQSYLDFKKFVSSQGANQSAYISIVHDYGRQKWWNDKYWIDLQLHDVYINGNFVPNASPAQLR